MKLSKPDEMEYSHHLKSSRNGFMVYTVALAIWVIYDIIAANEFGLAFIILILGNLVFLWSKVFLNAQTKTKEDKIKIPTKTILWTIIIALLFLAIIFIIDYYF
ncbi:MULTISPECIES: hypothetical protein [Gracilibacillus]|uniref:hypothetical protein n=1 Tax=Gracilibacillus TaxID=74385 RepID=UPI0008264D16|nr:MULTISPECIES: hypothetical protein [Gracilibacillus]